FVGDLNCSCPAGCFDFPYECHAYNFSLSPPPLSVLKIRFLPLEKAKNGKSEQVRCYNYYIESMNEKISQYICKQ
ncbi:MAG: hypothetical protein WAV05_10540, partial [Anaerolineales bacterium]